MHPSRSHGLFSILGLLALVSLAAPGCGVATPTVAQTNSQSPGSQTPSNNTSPAAGDNSPASNMPASTGGGDPNSTAMGFVRHGLFVVPPQKNNHRDALDSRLNRSDVTVDSASKVAQTGMPLHLSLTLYDAAHDGEPLQGALVDLFQVNALGILSRSAADGTLDQDFLRGYQISDAAGNVTFDTIVPGWTLGHAPHIEVRVREGSAHYLWSTRLFLQDGDLENVYRVLPYAKRGGRPTQNLEDPSYNAPCQIGATTVPCGSLSTLQLDVDSFGRASAHVQLHLDTQGT